MRCHMMGHVRVVGMCELRVVPLVTLLLSRFLFIFGFASASFSSIMHSAPPAADQAPAHSWNVKRVGATAQVFDMEAVRQRLRDRHRHAALRNVRSSVQQARHGATFDGRAPFHGSASENAQERQDALRECLDGLVDWSHGDTCAVDDPHAYDAVAASQHLIDMVDSGAYCPWSGMNRTGGVGIPMEAFQRSAGAVVTLADLMALDAQVCEEEQRRVTDEWLNRMRSSLSGPDGPQGVPQRANEWLPAPANNAHEYEDDVLEEEDLSYDEILWREHVLGWQSLVTHP